MRKLNRKKTNLEHSITAYYCTCSGCFCACSCSECMGSDMAKTFASSSYNSTTSSSNNNKAGSALN